MSKTEYLPKMAKTDRIALPYYSGTTKRWLFLKAQPAGVPRTKRHSLKIIYTLLVMAILVAYWVWAFHRLLGQIQ